jgi:hypothetical protein
MTGIRLSTRAEIDGALGRIHRVAVVGLSPRPRRPSHGVAMYLQEAGLRVLPVNPCGGSILGETVYDSVGSVPEPNTVDAIDVFRRPDALPGLVTELAGLFPPGVSKPLLWFQLGVRHPGAEAQAIKAGFDLVADRCLLVEHRRWKEGSS